MWAEVRNLVYSPSARGSCSESCKQRSVVACFRNERSLGWCRLRREDSQEELRQVPWGPGKTWLELGGGGLVFSRSDKPTAASLRNEGASLCLRSCWTASPSRLQGVRSWAQTQPGHLETTPGATQQQRQGPHPPPTHLPAGTFLAKSIFALLGSSVEIKRLFAVTNVANSDETI